ncbi:hypothetical protein GCM10009111_09710 [Colwellia asteriadis]|uniref:Uncharacterized protein n=1 Tax=Colwellia asteriadis TaxID=517723 RepID=A0ABP3WJK4_9GAMM
MRESCEIDWYLQAELAYNKRFAMKDAVDEHIDDSLDKKLSISLWKKTKPKKFVFCNTVVFQPMK